LFSNILQNKGAANMSTKTRLGAIAIAVGAAISGGASAADNTFYIGGA
jgi:hypothetical protein